MVGFGFDVHRLESGRKLILGGVDIESPVGSVAHSDGDVLIHAVMDSLLGACGLGDIGEHFPDTDERYKGVSSFDLLASVMELLNENGLDIVNIDAMLVLEKPKIAPHKDDMRRNIAAGCGIRPERVNIKATTNERMGYVGRSEGIVAYSVCQLAKRTA